MAFTKILIPVDMRHRDESAKSLEVAAGMTKAGAQCLLMTVANPLGKHLADTPEQQRAAFEDFAKMSSHTHGTTFQPVFRSHESPDVAILRECREQAVDLVVMASHDPRLSDHLFGSHASHIARDAPCSVLVVR